jgi:hypothetical protein
MEVTGKIKFIGTVQQVTDSFKKRELVVTTDEQYPQHLLIEFAQDKCIFLDGYKVGESVTVGINLRGREWINPQSEVKYFNQIQGWKINKSGEASEPTQTYDEVPLWHDNEPNDLAF